MSKEDSRQLKKIFDGKLIDKSWLDLECDERECLYKNAVKIIKFGGVKVDGQEVDLHKADGARFFIGKDGKVVTETVCGYTGKRPWN